MSLRFRYLVHRNFLVWRKLMVASLLGNLADPLIYLLGLGYGFLRIERLSRIVGLPRAMEFLFTAKQFSSREAYEMGLVNGVAADAELDAMVAKITDAIAQNALAKASAREIAKPESLQDHKKLEKMAVACFDSEDFKEGRRAFMEKRKPVFKGK